MKIKTFTFALLASLLIVGNAFAQNEEAQEKPLVLTLDDALEYAKKNNRQLKSADIDLDIKRRASANAWNVFLPTVQVSGTMSRTTDISSSINQANSLAGLAAAVTRTQPILIEDTESMHWTAIGNLSASLNLSLAYIQQIRAAKENYELGKISWEQSQRETLTNIKKLFYGLLVQKENLAIQETSLQNARNRYEQAAANFRNGRIPELSLLQTQVTYENKRPEFETVQKQYMQQLDMFAFLLGMPAGSKIELEGSIESQYIDLDADALLNKYMANNLDYRTLEGNIRVLKMNLSAINLSTYSPFLALSYSYQPLHTDALDSSWTADDAWTDGGSFSVTLGWNLTNLLPWSSNRQQAKDLEANIKKLELNLETVVENEKLEIKKAVDNINLCKAQIESMERNVTLAQRAYDMSARSYRNGTTERLDLLDSETQLNQAKLGLVSQKNSYISYLLDLADLLCIDVSDLAVTK